MNTLDRILARKREEVAERSAACPLGEMRRRAQAAPPARGFERAMRARIDAGEAAVIAEIKRASPSKGLIRADFDPPAIARQYRAGGAACLSVLTDVDFFQGSDEYLLAARAAVDLPVLRKDFIIDAWQIHEARALGADCVLLIVAALDDHALVEFSGLADELGMDALIEVHDAEEMQRARRCEPRLLGINNRNLKTFETSLDTTLALMHHAPAQALLVTESGIHDAADVTRMRAAGIDAFLVGEAFMRAPDPGVALADLFGRT